MHPWESGSSITTSQAHGWSLPLYLHPIPPGTIKTCL